MLGSFLCSCIVSFSRSISEKLYKSIQMVGFWCLRFKYCTASVVVGNFACLDENLTIYKYLYA